MAGEYKSSIKLGISLKPTSEIQNELNSAIQQLEKNSSIDLKIDTKQINQSLNEFSNTLNNISNQIKNGLGLQNVFNGQASGIDTTVNKLKDLNKELGASKQSNTFKINSDGTQTLIKDLKVIDDEYGKVVQTTNTYDEKTGKLASTIATVTNSEKERSKIANQTQDAWDKAYNKRISSEKKALAEIEANEKKAYDNEILRLGEKAIAEQKAQEKLVNQMGKGNEKTQINRNNSSKNDELTQAKAVNKALEDNYQAYLKLEKVKSSMQSKLNNSKSNEFIDESVITKLQSKLNGINTNTAEKELKELQQTINNLGSSDSQIVRLQNTISKMENNLTNMKGKYGSLVGDSSSKAQLESYTSQVAKLKTTLTSLQSGGTISGQKLASELNLGTNASRELSTAVKNSSSALRLAQKDATTFGESLKHALQNTGLYLGTYQAIQMLTNTFKDAITYVVQLDSAMTNLKKVTSETGETYSKFLNQAHDIAMDYGSQADKVVDATTSWAKTGESLKNATELAKSTMLLTKVGDIENVGMAQQYMIAPLKAFNIEAEKSVTLIDKYNNISNNMATDTVDLGEALSKSASSMSTAGNTLEQTLALIATAESQTKLGGDVIGQALLKMGAIVA